MTRTPLHFLFLATVACGGATADDSSPPDTQSADQDGGLDGAHKHAAPTPTEDAAKDAPRGPTDAGQSPACSPDLACGSPCNVPGVNCAYGPPLGGYALTCSQTADGGHVWLCGAS